MAFSTVTNANVDTAAALVPYPFGPLTRVGSVVAAGPNSQLPIDFTLAAPFATTHVYLSYDQISDLDTVTDSIKDQIGLQAVIHDLMLVTRVVDRYMTQETIPPATSPEYMRIINAFRHINTLFAQVPNIAPIEYQHTGLIEADFTVVDADGGGAGLAAAVTPTITGDVSMVLWEWGDGTSTIEIAAPFDPANHTYGSAGAKTVTMTAIGRGGVVTVRKSVTMA
jgi:hypothetical protein